MQTNKFFLFVRAITTLALFVGFYIFSLMIVAILLYFASRGLFAGEGRTSIFAIFSLIAAGVILWSIVPRFDKYAPPGSVVDLQKNPRLAAMIRSVARKLNEPIPKEIYFTGECNAFVAERGGLMGFGSHRVMGIGLPLMQLLSINELKVILAHEFGHFSNRDTVLGSWVYTTHDLIFRTLDNLEQANSLLQYPFIFYAKMFLRVSHGISRHQEFVADKCAVEVFGQEVAISALKKVHAAAGAFEAFWDGDVSPAIVKGYLPKVNEGFCIYLSSKNFDKDYRVNLRASLRAERNSPYDTHPTLSERILAINEISNSIATVEGAEGEAAISLVSDIQGIERKLFVLVQGEEFVAKLKEIDWDKMPEKIIYPYWESFVKKNAEYLSQFKWRDVSDFGTKVAEFASKIKFEEPVPDFPEKDLWKVNSIIGSALCVWLYNNGWSLNYLPGSNMKLEKESLEIEPFEIVSDLMNGEISAEQWQGKCREIGISDQSLCNPVKESEKP